jgi:hypothetical protein
MIFMTGLILIVWCIFLLVVWTSLGTMVGEALIILKEGWIEVFAI